MSESRFAPILRADLAELTSYAPLEGRFDVRLDANEPPPLLTPDASAALARAMLPSGHDGAAAWNRYPDARSVELREAIAARCDAKADEILVGVGTDEVIALILTALDRPRARGVSQRPAIVTTSPTFVMYRLSAKARGFQVVEVPLDAGWDLDVAGMRRGIAFAEPNVIFIATPNNPTGGLMSLDRLEAVIQAAPPDALVIVDEAYVDFSTAGRSQLDLRHRYPNVAVLRTLSKVGFAALRVGWLIGPSELVHEIDKVRQPYNVPVPSQRGATFVLRELWGEVERMRDLVVAERTRLAAGLVGLGLGVAESHANFVWCETRRPAKDVFEALAARGVLVKSFHASGGRLAQRLRITVGLASENDRLLEEIARCA